MKLFKQTLDNTITALALGIALAYFGMCIYYLTYNKTESKTVRKALSCAPETGSMNANEFRRCLLQQHLDGK